MTRAELEQENERLAEEIRKKIREKNQLETDIDALRRQQIENMEEINNSLRNELSSAK